MAHSPTPISAYHIIRALRLPFVVCSVLPFLIGYILPHQSLNLATLFLGLLVVSCTHLSANLINDYADSKSGVDWTDKKYYGFFGGSKLIQENILSEFFYYRAAAVCVCLAISGVIALAIVINNLWIIPVYFGIILLAWGYSLRPLQFSYRRVGEILIFILFGFAPVLGGYYVQTKIFFTTESCIVSIILGLLTTMILIANEVPDYDTDREKGKFTFVSIVKPPHIYIVYSILGLMVFVCHVSAVIVGVLPNVSLLALLFVIPAYKAALILKQQYSSKTILCTSSRLSILTFCIVALSILGSLLV
jgi:1,4-dihydroxy-2-naphthoate polyprenyltransferase